MSDKLERYRRGDRPQGKTNRLWPLYGAGLDNLGVDGKCIEVSLPTIGPDELLIRHDACGLCFSDIKVIRLGQQHPRITKDIHKDPVVLGHEVSITVVQVGSHLADRYRPGDRFIVQAEIYKNGENLAYGYMLQGGLSEYARITDTILNGDDGNYLLPVQPATGYAESALTEPWACVTAAYELKYREAIKPAGALCIIGGPGVRDRAYTIGRGLDETSHPALVCVSHVPPGFETWLRARCSALRIPFSRIDDLAHPEVDGAGPRTNFDGKAAANHFDDIVLLEPTPELIETASPHLADFGVCVLAGEQSLSRRVHVDVGRVHYNRWVFVGSTSPDIADAYRRPAVRAALQSRGRAWFVGAGGPMGRMHLQRAIQIADGPAQIVCTDVSDLRLNDLYESYRAEAEARGVELICLNPTHTELYAEAMAHFEAEGFDDIVVLAPVAPLIADSARWLAPNGVMNVFAGVARGTLADLDLGEAYLAGKRIIGHSASSIDDLRLMLNFAETNILSPNRSVAAIGSLEAVKDGLQALMDTVYPGKVVIYPHLKPLSLTAVPDLQGVLPSVYEKLKDGREWTNEAEAELLRVMLREE